MTHACADPGMFARGGPTLTKFFLLQIMREGGSIYHLKWAIIGPPAKRHLKHHFADGPMMA